MSAATGEEEAVGAGAGVSEGLGEVGVSVVAGVALGTVLLAEGGTSDGEGPLRRSPGEVGAAEPAGVPHDARRTKLTTQATNSRLTS